MARLVGHFGIVLFIGCIALLLFRLRPGGDRLIPSRHIHQSDPECSCGPVSVAVVVRLMGKEASIEEINALIQIPPTGTTSMFDLKTAIEKIGLDVLAVQSDPARGIPRRCGPVILHLVHDHFITAVPIDATRSIVIDPPKNPQLVSIGELRRNWDGTALIVCNVGDQSSPLP